MNLDTVYKHMKKVAWPLPAGSDQYLRYQNPSGNFNGSTTTPFNMKPAAPAKKPYGNPDWQNKPEWEAPEGFSNQGTFGQIGSNLKNWFGQKTWDVGHAVDTALGTGFTAGKKRPGQGNTRTWGFWDYALPGLGLARDFYSGLGNVFDVKPQTETQVRKLPDWQKRMLAEQKGTLDMSKGRDAYNKQIVLPDNQVFGQMAAREANGQQYDKLRQAGWSPEQITNYVMREKYLPLVRHATGKQNITGSEQLTPQQMETIKKEMMNRQMRGVENNLNKVDPKTGLSNQAFNDKKNQQAYQEALSQAYDARTQAMRNGEDPDKVKINYSDAIKKNKAMSDAVTRASQNSW